MGRKELFKTIQLAFNFLKETIENILQLGFKFKEVRILPIVSNNNKNSNNLISNNSNNFNRLTKKYLGTEKSYWYGGIFNTIMSQLYIYKKHKKNLCLYKLDYLKDYEKNSNDYRTASKQTAFNKFQIEIASEPGSRHDKNKL